MGNALSYIFDPMLMLRDFLIGAAAVAVFLLLFDFLPKKLKRSRSEIKL